MDVQQSDWPVAKTFC